METKKQGGQSCPHLGNQESQYRLTVLAQERAAAVLADPQSLRKVGGAAPLLALVSERCGDAERCRIKYTELAVELGVSVTTIKAWSDSLERLGYYTRTPCGPAGVDIQLCPEAWPCPGTGTALTDTLGAVAGVLDALRVTIDRVLDSAVTDVRRMMGSAA